MNNSIQSALILMALAFCFIGQVVTQSVTRTLRKRK